MLAGMEEPDSGSIRMASDTTIGYLPQDGIVHHGRSREVPLEELLGAGDVLDGHETAGGIVLEHAVHEHERVLGRDLPDETRDVDGGGVHARVILVDGAA